MSNVAAGWYPDPSDASHDRYWDGGAWTEHRNARQQAPYVAGRASSAATTSLVLGILAILVAGFFTGVPAMVIGRRAGREIDASQGRLTGGGNATAGFVTGLIGTLWSGLALLVVILVFAFGSSLSDSFEDTCSTVGSSSQASSC
jgi:uncharacterized protein DUF2510/uncharacterized protein DUF4190